MSTKRFDHLWHDAIVEAYGKLQRHARLAGRHLKEIRRQTYRFAKGVLEMQNHYPNELKAMIESEQRTPTQWMDEHFELIEQMEETRERIFSAIEAGVTEREFVADAKFFIGQKRITAAAVKARDDGVIPHLDIAPADAEEKARFFRENCESMIAKYQAVRHELKVTRQELGHARVRITKLERTIKRLKKDIDALYQPSVKAEH